MIIDIFDKNTSKVLTLFSITPGSNSTGYGPYANHIKAFGPDGNYAIAHSMYDMEHLYTEYDATSILEFFDSEGNTTAIWPIPSRDSNTYAGYNGNYLCDTGNPEELFYVWSE